MWFYKQLTLQKISIYFSPALTGQQNNTLPARFATQVPCIIYHTTHFNSSIPFIQSPNLNESAPQKLNTPFCSQLDNKTGYIFLKFLRSQSQHCPFDTEHSPLYRSCIFFSSAKNPKYEQFIVYTMSINFTLD